MDIEELKNLLEIIRMRSCVKWMSEQEEILAGFLALEMEKDDNHEAWEKCDSERSTLKDRLRLADALAGAVGELRMATTGHESTKAREKAIAALGEYERAKV